MAAHTLGFGEVFRTPQGAGEPLPPCDEREFVVRELEGGVLECTSPMYDTPYRIGDRSAFEDPNVDRFMQLHLQHNGLGFSTRHLTNTEAFETKSGTGRWSSMGHQINVAYTTARLGGSPQQIMYAAVHDAGKRLGAHRTDDLCSVRGLENGHELDLSDTLHRNGFIALLKQEGVIDAEFRFSGSGLHIETVLKQDDDVYDFTNQPGRNRSMESERLEYLSTEGIIWVVDDAALVREAVGHAVRASHAEHGEHLVFDDPDAATLFNIIQTRCATEHWGDSLNDVIDELLMTLDRRMLTYYNDKKHVSIGKENTDYYPGDVLYMPEEDWQAEYRKIAEVDPFTRAILKIVTRLAQQQRNVHDTYDSHGAYKGPVAPAWLELQAELPLKRASDNASAELITHTVQGVRKGPGTTMTAEMLPGKERATDAWVICANGLWRRLSEVNPESARYRTEHSQWLAKGPYQARIDYGHKALGLTDAEKRSIGPGLSDIQALWPKALQRPKMPADLLATRFARAATRTRLRGRGINPDAPQVRDTRVA